MDALMDGWELIMDTWIGGRQVNGEEREGQLDRWMNEWANGWIGRWGREERRRGI